MLFYILIFLLIVVLALILYYFRSNETFKSINGAWDKNPPWSFKYKRNKNTKNIKILAVGSSSIDPFKLIKDSQLIVEKFTGATAKGVSKPDNENHIKIRKLVSKYKPENMLFHFGAVDLNFSYYYRACKEKSAPEPDEFVNEIAKKYIEFIKSLDVKNKIVLCPYYSPVEDKYAKEHFEKYKIPIENCDLSKIFIRKLRNELVDKFADALVKYSSDVPNITIININSELSENGIIKDEFKDIHIFNTHLLWEPIIHIYIKKLEKFGISEKHLANTKRTFKKYYNKKLDYYTNNS